MKSSFLFLLLLTLSLPVTLAAQRRAAAIPAKPRPARSAEIGQDAVVVDETLSVLRRDPSLFAESIQRMRRGRHIKIMGASEADGVRFYKVTAPPNNFGWVQADAVFGKFRPTDEQRLASLVQASNGFDQVETAVEFFALYPDSKLKPAILLLFGDLLEEVAVKLSKDANNKLSRREMAAVGAPLHSYYLNYVSLDRYRKIGVRFVFNPAARLFHYDGAAWNEIVTKFPASAEASEAKNRLDGLRTKMEVGAPKQ